VLILTVVGRKNIQPIKKSNSTNPGFYSRTGGEEGHDGEPADSGSCGKMAVKWK